jgi:hypothetical protein
LLSNQLCPRDHLSFGFNGRRGRRDGKKAIVGCSKRIRLSLLGHSRWRDRFADRATSLRSRD